MNQATNLVQWKNHTEEQKGDFDFDNYKYECQPVGSKNFIGFLADCSDNVYRLVIEKDKYYYVQCPEIKNGKPYIEKGCELLKVSRKLQEACSILRPAKPHEIPKPNLSDISIKIDKLNEQFTEILQTLEQLNKK